MKMFKPKSLTGKLSKEQIAWASRHDWFVRESKMVPGTIIIVDEYTLDGKSYSEMIGFNGTFKELREWAGY